MEVTKKRIFVGNLPSDVSKSDVIKRFSDFGNVESLEIKNRPDLSAFAFLDLETDVANLKSCFSTLSKKKWNGNVIKLELAKESFLSRLEKERRETPSEIQEFAESKQSELVSEKHVNLSTTKRHKKLSPKETHKRVKKFKFKEADSDNSNDNEIIYNGNLAKESSFSRLEKERREGQSEIQGFAESKQNELNSENHENLSTTKRHKKISPKETHKHVKGIEFEEADSDSSSDNEVMYKGKLRMFGGTSIISSEPEKNHDDEICQSEATATDLLRRLENFSSIWKDPPEKVNQIEKEVKQKGKRILSEEKRMLSEEKRKKSVEERRKSFQKQKETIKLALSSKDSGHRNNKIVFGDEDESDNEMNASFGDTNILNESTSKPNLFEDTSDGEEDEVENSFKIKPQFEGTKGQKLLQLQSRFGNDSRFAMDERFYESDEENEGQPVETGDSGDERKRQFEILENVLGHKISMTGKKKEKTKHTPMIRYDPTNPDHVKFETKIEPKVKKRKVTGIPLEKEEVHTRSNESEAQVVVSKETFYKVTDTLKETLKKRNESTEEFSLRKLFGTTDKADHLEKEEIYTTKLPSQPEWTTEPFRCESVEPELPLQQNQSHSEISERFFFVKDDPRFQEGLDWINGSQTKDESFDYAKHRRELKRIVRTKVKNNIRNNRPWKRKLGSKISKKFNKRRQNN